jgi:hypothetical protein
VSINPNFTRWIEALTAPDLKQRFSSTRKALEALETGDSLISFSDTIHQPVQSKIQVNNT